MTLREAVIPPHVFSQHDIRSIWRLFPLALLRSLQRSCSEVAPHLQGIVMQVEGKIACLGICNVGQCIVPPIRNVTSRMESNVLVQRKYLMSYGYFYL